MSDTELSEKKLGSGASKRKKEKKSDASEPAGDAGAELDLKMSPRGKAGLLSQIGFECSYCGIQNWDGDRFHCSGCEYDLCGDCFKSGGAKDHAKIAQKWLGNHAHFIRDSPEDEFHPKGVVDLILEAKAERPSAIEEFLAEGEMPSSASKNAKALDHHYGRLVSNVFRVIDRDATGTVTAKELRAAVHLLKLNSDDRNAMKALVKDVSRRAAAGSNETELDQVVVSLLSFADVCEKHRSPEVDRALHQILAIYNAKLEYSFDSNLIWLAIFPILIMVLSAGYAIILAPWEDRPIVNLDQDEARETWLENAQNISSITDEQVRLRHLVYGGYLDFTWVAYVIAAMQIFPNLYLLANFSARRQFSHGFENHRHHTMRWILGTIFHIAGLVLAGVLLVVVSVPIDAGVTTNRVFINGIITFLDLWQMAFLFQLITASALVSTQGIVSIFRDYRLLTELPVDVLYGVSTKLKSGYDLVHIVQRLREPLLSYDNTGKRLMTRIHYFFFSFGIIAPVFYLTTPYYVNWNGATFGWQANDVPLIAAMCIAGAVSVWTFAADAYEITFGYYTVQIDMKLVGELLLTSGSTPYMMLDKPANIRAWYHLREFLASGGLKADIFNRAQLGFSVVSIYFLFGLIVYLGAVWRSNIGFFVTGFLLSIFLGGYLFHILFSAAKITSRQQEHLGQLQKHKFTLTVNASRLDAATRTKVNESVNYISQMMTLLSETDIRLQFLGIVPINRQSLAAIRGLTATVIIAGFSSFDFAFIPEAVSQEFTDLLVQNSINDFEQFIPS
jgi:hypothetical protein